jgi:hypothetical protein
VDTGALLYIISFIISPERTHASETHSKLCYIQNIFQKVCSFSLMTLISQGYQTVNVEALSDREQMEVALYSASFTGNCDNVIGRRCSQEHKST